MSTTGFHGTESQNDHGVTQNQQSQCRQLYNIQCCKIYNKGTLYLIQVSPVPVRRSPAARVRLFLSKPGKAHTNSVPISTIDVCVGVCDSVCGVWLFDVICEHGTSQHLSIVASISSAREVSAQGKPIRLCMPPEWS